MKHLLFPIFGILCLFSNNAWSQSQDTALLRFADIHREHVVFVYSGDIYISRIDGGVAKRLTSHHGKELFPKFSRDGKKIAFSAEFSGNRQVFIMDVDGSNLQQLTWYNDVGVMPPRGGFDYRILDWDAQDKHVIVRANRLPYGKRMGRPYKVPVTGGLAEAMAIPESGGGMLSPDGKQFVYTPIDREWRTWKRHRGGRAQDVWTYDLTANTSKRLTTHRATDQQPVWVGENIFFVSDRDYTLNLYRYNEQGQPEKITQHQDFDVLWPSAGPDAIVYENGGKLWRYVPAAKTNKQLNITVAGARQNRLPSFKSVAGNIESVSLSHDGKRAAMAARGEVFTVPAKKGEISNISRTAKAREISVSWSPNGRYIAYLSDASGEYELYIRDLKNDQQEIKVTSDATIWRFRPVWSPDSKKLAYADKNQTLWYVDINKKRPIRVTRSDYNDITEYTFSPDSNWLAYTKTSDNFLSAIWAYNLSNKQNSQLTPDTSNERNPSFDPSGKYLYFLSDRDFNLSFSSLEFNYLYQNSTRVYLGLLNQDIKSPFAPESDEVAIVSDKDQKDSENKNGDDNKVKVTIDIKGFNDRVMALNFKSSNYRNLQATENGVFVIENTAQHSSLKMYDLKKKKKPKTVLKKVNGYELSHDGKKILASLNGSFSIIDAAADQSFADNKLNLSAMQVKVDPMIEWQQMYKDAWRILRDWFYDPNIHGMDWQKIHDRYAPLVKHIAHRSDLDYILGEIAGELNAGHIYVQRGDESQVKRIDGGLLGAELSRDKSGYYRIDKIFAGENWHQALRSPLTEAGTNASPSDYIIAINGQSTKSVNNIYALLENTAGRTIDLRLNSKPQIKGSWLTKIKPIASETSLRYLDWVNSRKAVVDKLSNGRIGYIHLPNTAVEGNRELFKQMLPQMNKDALIIDDRYNGGGFIPDRMMEILGRKTLNYWIWRGLKPNPTPLFAHDGPKAMLINGYSSSGGDALPYYFRKMGLGKLIGTRTWGGLIGISGNPSLADGGQVLASTFRIMDTDGQWVVENEGVTPDIEVIDRPELVAKGQDPSLERAVKELLKDLQTNPRKRIKIPPTPSKF